MKCAHPTCTCTETSCQKGDRRYCSDACVTDHESTTADCECQHADCSARVGAATSDRRTAARA